MIRILNTFLISALALSCSSESSDPAPLGGSAGVSGGAAGTDETPPGTGGSGALAGAAGSSTSGGSGGEGGGGGAGNGGFQAGSGGVLTEDSGGATGGSSGTAWPDANIPPETGAAGGPPASAGCPAGALLCDDFESYTAMAPPNGKWKVTNVGSPTTVVDAVHAYSGSKAVHFHGISNNNSQYTFMTAAGAPTFPVATDKLYVRFMLYVARWPAGTHTRLAWVGTAQALSTPQRGFDGAGYSLCNYNGIAIERFASGYFRNTSKHLVDASRRDKWSCFEFEIDNKGGPPPRGSGTALPHIWEDGQEYSLALAGSKSVPYNAIPFEALQFSIWSPQSDAVAADYWVDDVVMSKVRINCPKLP